VVFPSDHFVLTLKPLQPSIRQRDVRPEAIPFSVPLFEKTAFPVYSFSILDPYLKDCHNDYFCLPKVVLGNNK